MPPSTLTPGKDAYRTHSWERTRRPPTTRFLAFENVATATKSPGYGGVSLA